MTRHIPRVHLAFRAHDQFARSIAARSGVGRALLPHYIRHSDPHLRFINLRPVPPSKDVFLLIPHDSNRFGSVSRCPLLGRRFLEDDGQFSAMPPAPAAPQRIRVSGFAIIRFAAKSDQTQYFAIAFMGSGSLGDHYQRLRIRDVVHDELIRHK